MRYTAVLVLLAAASLTGSAADPAVNTGLWRQPAAGTRAVDADGRRYLVNAPAAEDNAALDDHLDREVRYAVEDKTLTVFDDRGAAHHLALAAIIDLHYAAIGAGHFIRSVGSDGESVTLEDRSEWVVDGGFRFITAHWTASAGISVTRTTDDPEFPYELDNLDEDAGVPVRFNPH